MILSKNPPKRKIAFKIIFSVDLISFGEFLRALKLKYSNQNLHLVGSAVPPLLFFPFL